MNNLNRVTLIGILLKDLSLNYTKKGNSVANGVLISSHVWFDISSMSYRRQIERSSLAFYDGLATSAIAELSSGLKIFVEGHLSTKRTADDSGNFSYRTKIIVERYVAFTENYDEIINGEDCKLSGNKNKELDC